MKSALLFSGQGSQYVGMLKDIFENSTSAKKQIEKGNEILGFDFSQILFDGPVDKLKETRFTQPALFLHSAVVFDLLRSNLSFDAVAGHSVGEYAALYSAGVLSFEDALRLVSLRGKLMFEAGEKVPGTMFAIIGADDDKVNQLCNDLTESGNGEVVVAANFNSVGQVVVSGSADYLRANANSFKTVGAKMVAELQVSGAFHSPLMQPAKEELEKAINGINFNNANVPVYANICAKPLVDSNEIKSALILQLTSPVYWTQTMIEMQKNDINSFIEIGPGKVLQGLAKRTLKEIEISGFDKFDDIEKKIS
ncbi:MAG: ACP S-malonyltransferase [Candidatus Kapabacteria bacterium]|nr:ACP S-malonyltransferase [Candidatus Kapabacteria bacterium]